MVVYLGTDYEKALAIISGNWSRSPTFLYKSLAHATKRAVRLTNEGQIPVVVELHYTSTRRLCYNPHKCGYHTSLKPVRARIKWISVNGGSLLYNY